MFIGQMAQKRAAKALATAFDFAVARQNLFGRIAQTPHIFGRDDVAAHQITVAQQRFDFTGRRQNFGLANRIAAMRVARAVRGGVAARNCRGVVRKTHGEN